MNKVYIDISKGFDRSEYDSYPEDFKSSFLDYERDYIDERRIMDQNDYLSELGEEIGACEDEIEIDNETYEFISQSDRIASKAYNNILDRIVDTRSDNYEIYTDRVWEYTKKFKQLSSGKIYEIRFIEFLMYRDEGEGFMLSSCFYDDEPYFLLVD